MLTYVSNAVREIFNLLVKCKQMYGQRADKESPKNVEKCNEAIQLMNEFIEKVEGHTPTAESNPCQSKKLIL